MAQVEVILWILGMIVSVRGAQDIAWVVTIEYNHSASLNIIMIIAQYAS